MIGHGRLGDIAQTFNVTCTYATFKIATLFTDKNGLAALTIAKFAGESDWLRL
jgi:hypothetical protein